MGVINGTPAGYCRYGYFSDFAQYQFQTYTDDDSLCSGEMVTLFADPIENATYTWTGPSGFSINQSVLTIGPVDETYDGMYIVTGNVGDCEITPDTLILTVQPPFTAPDLIWDAPTCAGDDLILTCPTAGNNWQWTGPNGELVESDSILVISNAQPSDGGPIYSTSGSGRLFISCRRAFSGHYSNGQCKSSRNHCRSMPR